MVSTASLLPTRAIRAAPSGLPRPATSVSTLKAPPHEQEHQPVASTSKLPPVPPTPARSEYEASRLDWEDLLASRSDGGGFGEDDLLLNDQSASWLLDRSAFTIGARTPGKAKTASRRLQSVPTEENETIEAEAAKDAMGASVVAPSQGEQEGTRRDHQCGPTADLPLQSSSPRALPHSRPPSDDAVAQSAEHDQAISEVLASHSNDEQAVAEPPEEAASVSEQTTKSAPESPPTSGPDEAPMTTAETTREQSRSPVIPRRHRPSLVPLPQTSAPLSPIPDTASSRKSPAPIPSSISASVPSEAPPATTADPSPTAEDAALPKVDEAEHEVVDLAATSIKSASSGVAPRSFAAAAPEARSRTPRASLAVTGAAAPLVRPAHILPADHPAHPRFSLAAPTLPATSSTTATSTALATNSSTKGIRAPDEDAKRKVREAKEAREKSAKERKEKAEKAAETLRDAARKEKLRAEEAAAARMALQKDAVRAEQAKTMAPPPVRASKSTTASHVRLKPAPSDAPSKHAKPMTSSSEAPAKATTSAVREPTPPAPPALPIIIEEATHDDISTTEQHFDPNVTLPDMGAPLDFGPSDKTGSKGAEGLAAGVTSTPARHLLKRKDVGDDIAHELAEERLKPDDTRESKRPRRVSHSASTALLAEVPSTARSIETILEVEEATSAAANSAAATCAASAPSRTSAASAPSGRSQTKRRRPSRASQVDVRGDTHSDDAPIESSLTSAIGSHAGRARVVRVTLVAPAPPLRAASVGASVSTRANVAPASQEQPQDLPPSLALERKPSPAPDAVKEKAEQPTAEAKTLARSRRASRVAIPVEINGVDKATVDARPPSGSASRQPATSTADHVPTAPVASLSYTVQLPPRPKLKPAIVIGGITLPATFSFAEPNQESEAERQRRLADKERREKAAEQVLAEKKRLRESASAWAVRPEETAKRPRLLDPPSVTESDAAGLARLPSGSVVHGTAEAAPSLRRPPRRSVTTSAPRRPISVTSDSPDCAEEHEQDLPTATPLALTKEALERNARKAGPRPDLHRRVSRFLEEISEADEPMEDVSALLVENGEPEEAQRVEIEAVEEAIPTEEQDGPAVRAESQPSAALDPPSSAVLSPPHRATASASLPLRPEAALPPATTIPPVKAASKLNSRGANQILPSRRPPPSDDKTAQPPPPAKKARRDTAPAPAPAISAATAARTRPRTGKENGPTQQGGVAAALEKQLQARLEWSERQKRREEEVKRFRQRQRDEEAAREREKLLQLRSSLNQARRKPAAVGRT
ncbi:hypothetical protein JCM10908_003954 [Rhodotorula pacifica]|uniref:uncharacterized protein n=1 Tax=Rhodotorula pacifica TaxID=1495444 RepID=UPI0031721546